MNDEIKLSAADGTDQGDVTSNTVITDFTQVVSCAVGNNRYEQRRAKIRAALVREHFDHELESPPGLSGRLLKLFRLD
jgi:hypothetical protein